MQLPQIEALTLAVSPKSLLCIKLKISRVSYFLATKGCDESSTIPIMEWNCSNSEQRKKGWVRQKEEVSKKEDWDQCCKKFENRTQLLLFDKGQIQ
ncbi:MAG: hypothetical protein DSY83_12520 [Flavobacteriia bacterium]|nr:MAG: hypothetical protein DSY83_12520 [Flavobacteriia bacterium]